MNRLKWCILATILSISQSLRSGLTLVDGIRSRSHKTCADTSNKYKHDAYVKNNVNDCSGTIIDDEYILTAAHCVIKPNSKIAKDALKEGLLKVSVGIKRIDGQDEYHTVRLVESFYVSKGYYHYNNASGVKLTFGDFAVLKLNHKLGLDYNSKIKKLKLPHKSYVQISNGTWYSPELDNDHYLNRQLIYTGFGIIDLKDNPDGSKHSKSPNHLHYSPVKVLNSTKCKYLFPQVKLCAELQSDPMATTCSGDSGGALFDENTNEIIGLVSIGGKRCDHNVPTTYTKVVAFTNLIEEAMNNSSLRNLDKWTYAGLDIYKRELSNALYTQIDYDKTSRRPSNRRPKRTFEPSALNRIVLSSLAV